MTARLNTTGALALAAAVSALTLWRTDRDYGEHGTLTAITAALAWASYGTHLAAYVVGLRTEPRVVLPAPAARLAGTALVLAGTAMYTDSLRRFASFTQLAGRSNEQLITEGAHRYSRNPQNVGYGLALAGAALAARRPAALAVAAAFWPPFAAYTRVEEHHLARVYGEAYERYRARTPRYLGRPG